MTDQLGYLLAEHPTRAYKARTEPVDAAVWLSSGFTSDCILWQPLSSARTESGRPPGSTILGAKVSSWIALFCHTGAAAWPINDDVRKFSAIFH